MTFATVTRRWPGALSDAEVRLADWLARYSIGLLRISLGLVFLGFGVLKFVPGLLTLGLVPTQLGLVGVAALESTIGLLLLSGRWMRLALALLAVEVVGIMSPIALLPGEMFRGLFAPTLAGQYVLKDIIIAAAGLVVGARSLGARMVVEADRRVP
jgi:uncharacterized membrane protein YkgB